jgi:hypothetical protein
MAMLRGTPSGQCLASNRKCISAGEPNDKPATKGPRPISSSVWNCVGLAVLVWGHRRIDAYCHLLSFHICSTDQQNVSQKGYITHYAGTSPKYFIKNFVLIKRLFDPSLDEIAGPHNRFGYFIKWKCVLRSAHILQPLARI